MLQAGKPIRDHAHDAVDAPAKANSNTGRPGPQNSEVAVCAPLGGHMQRWRFLVESPKRSGPEPVLRSGIAGLPTPACTRRRPTGCLTLGLTNNND